MRRIKVVRVLLIEDHTAMREALASAFEQEVGSEVVGQAGSLAQARRMLEEEEQQQADVALIDLGLPDGDGSEFVPELREASPQTQALVLSASLERAEIARAVERGAAGFIHKSAGLDDVIEAVRRLRAGQTLMPLEEVVELLRFAARTREQENDARRATEKLPPREREVLQALAEGLDNQGVAERLHLSPRTVRNPMSSILRKLGHHRSGHGGGG